MSRIRLVEQGPRTTMGIFSVFLFPTQWVVPTSWVFRTKTVFSSCQYFLRPSQTFLKPSSPLKGRSFYLDWNVTSYSNHHPWPNTSKRTPDVMSLKLMGQRKSLTMLRFGDCSPFWAAAPKGTMSCRT